MGSRRRIRGAAVLAALAVAVLSRATVSAAPIRFVLPTVLAGDGIVSRTASTDIDADGRQDIVGLYGSLARFAIWRGLGERQFAAPIPSELSRAGSDVSAADVDGDGFGDVVVACASGRDSSLLIYFGSGSGLQSPLVIAGDSAGVSNVAIADLDGDQDLDLVANNPRTRRLLWAINQGLRSFGPLQSSFAGVAAGRLTLADHRGDGTLDAFLGFDATIWGAYPSDSLAVLPWASGSFGSPIRTGLPYANVIADLNGDGAADVLSWYHVQLGQPDGSFVPSEPLVTGRDASYLEPWALPIDLDGDGRLDLLQKSIRGQTTRALELIQGDSIRFRRVGRVDPSGLTSATAGDLDEDGRADAVSGRGNAAGILIRWNERGILGSPSAQFGDQRISEAWDLELGDVTGDARNDLVVSCGFHPSAILASLEGGGFDESRTFGSGDGRWLDLADMNGDGLLDILWDSNPGPAYTHASYSQSPGVYGDGYRFRYDTYPYGFTTGDLDGDGDLDVLLADGRRLDNDGAGTMLPQSSLLPFGRALIDVNDDQRADFVGAAGESLSIGLNLFGDVPPFETKQWAGGTIARWVHRDVNADGRGDFVIATTAGQLSVLLHLKGGGFAAPMLSPPFTLGSPACLVLGRFDADEFPDAVVTGSLSALGGADGVTTLKGLGDGTFGDVWQIAGTIGEAIAGDLDGDGLDDLAWLGSAYSYGFDDPVYVLRNSTLPAPTPVQVSNVSSAASPDRVTLEWWLGGDAVTDVGVERAAEGEAWREVARVTPDGSRLVRYEDRAVTALHRYGYRLRVRDGGAEKTLGEVWVSVPERVSFAIERVWPSPSRDGRVRVRLAVDRAEPVSLELLDVAGRVVTRRALSVDAPGLREFAWDVSAGAAGRLRAGLYWVKASQGARSVVSRVAIVP